MSKILLYSDIHHAQHKKSMDRLHDCIAVQEWVFQVARENNIKDIVFGGDLFQDREKIDIITYHLVFDVFLKNSQEFNVWLLLGNHDLWYYERWDITSVRAFSAIPNVKVIDKVCTLEIAGHDIDFLPFTHNPIKYIKQLEKTAKKRKGLKVLVGHLSLDGAFTNTKYKTYSDVIVEHDGEMVKVDASAFKAWDKVWLGHYHGPQEQGNVEYIGSPLQLSFGEVDQEKHIVIYDMDSGIREYINNEFSPKHLILSENELDKHDLEKNFVRVFVEDSGKSDLIDLRKDIEKSKPTTLELMPVQKDESEHFISDAKSILCKEDEMLKKYIEQVAPNLDSDKLLKIGEMICQKTPN